MALRDKLKQREEQREKAANGGINGDLPEGVTRYVRLSTELKGEGKPFVILRDPNLWYFYYVHEDGDFATRSTYVKKHTCLHSPRKAPETEEEADKLFDQFAKPDKSVCISDKAKAKRVLYFIVPVFDPEYNEWRVLDLKEFHVGNLINDMDKTEKAARKFDKNYTMIGDVVQIKKADKTYTIEGAEVDGETVVGEELQKAISGVKEEDIEDKLSDAIKEAAQNVDQTAIDYEELANFRDEEDMIEILRDADPERVDKSVLPVKTEGDNGSGDGDKNADTSAEEIPDEGSDGDIKF